MRKRLSSKLLAIILTLAICATTVLGCLMTVSAADNSVYAFGTHWFPSNDDLSQATLDVTIIAPDKLPNGFVTGAFGIVENDKDDDDCLVLEDVIIKNGESVFKDEDGNRLSDEDYVVFTFSEAVQTATFELVFSFSNGAASENKEYKVQLSDVELAYNDVQYFDVDDFDSSDKPVYEITTACAHVLAVVGAPLTTDDANGYSVYENSMCTKCGETFGYQLVPTTGELSDTASSEGITDTLAFGDYLTAMGSSSTYYDTNVADNGETGASWDDPIIIDSAEEFVYIAKTATNDTAGKYYKVADGIAAFDLSGGLVDPNGSLADELANIQGSSKNHSGGTPGFQGHFDGNGVTVYGAWCSNTSVSAYAGLFSCTQGNVTIKNVNVKLSSFTATTAVGGIVGYHKGDGTNTLTIENCSVTDSYLELTTTGYGHGIAGLVGYSANLSSWNEADKGVDGNNDGDMVDTIYVNGVTIVKNCFVNLDPTYIVSATKPGVLTDTTVRGTFGGLVGFMTSNGLSVDSCISIGITPYAVQVYTGGNDVQHTGLESHFTNVYTDQLSGSAVSIGGSSLGNRNFTGRVTQLDLANMKGSAAVLNMTALDWGTTWVMDGTDTYPRLATPGETFDTIYWDGTVAAGFSDTSAGTKDDPIIINTAAELAYLVSSDGNSGGAEPATKITVTAFSDGSPKYFKIADGIKSIVLQPYAYINDIKALDSAAAVKSYFEGGSFTPWKTTGWEGATFCGHFDGNGATIYGMYATSSNNAALFCTVDGGAAFENLAIKNSYLTSSADNYQVGALFGTSSTTGYGAKRDGIIWVNNITIANNYMYNGCLSTQTTRSGVIGSTQEAIQVENALIYGNDATYGRDSAIYDMPLLGNCSNAVQVATDATYYDGFTPKTVVDNGKTLYYNLIKNSIILDCDVANVKRGRNWRVNDPESFENVYTNFEGLVDGVITFPDSTIFTYSDTSLKKISAADALGSAAKAAMPGLAWGSEWYCGTISGYPVQAVFATLDASKYSTSELTLIGSNVAYNDDGSFDFNFHFVPETEGFVPTLYVGTVDKSKFMKLDTATESCYADQLGSTAIMYTIPNLSARDIDLVWLPTLVTEGSAILEWGKSEQIAIADNAKAVIAGDYDTADKNVAAALINYGSAADAALNASTLDYDAGVVDLLEFGDYLIELGSTNKYYDNKLDDNGETGESWDDPIIIDSAEEFVYLAKASGNDTAGKYYKVADGIAGFNLSTSALDLDGTLEDNLSIITSSSKNHSGSTPGFQGHFDGNGVTVYGAWTNDTWNSASNRYNTPYYAGLFSCTSGTVTIKNTNVKLSYFVGLYSAGGIVGYYKGDGTGSLTIENCSVTDTHIESWGVKDPTDTTKTPVGEYGMGVGALVGYANNYGNSTNGVITVNNCYVNLDEDNFNSPFELGTQTDTTLRGVHGGFLGFVVTNYDNNDAGNITNSIAIGIKPYATSSNTVYNDLQHSGLATHFANVYTDQTANDDTIIGGQDGWSGRTQNFTGRVTQLTEAQLTGIGADANMPALDWDNVWTTTSGYPTFISKDYVAPTSDYAIYWDGSSTKTAPTVGSGTKDDPYIISTVAEFAYITGQGLDNYAITLGKYYKIADGITSIVMQPEEYAADIMALGSAAEVKAYFEENAANLKQWLYYGWEGSTFCGNIDFNGATVYGIYQTSTSNAGLISNVDGGAAISNLSIRNSYMTSTAGNYQVGAIAAVTNGSGYGQKANGFVWFNNCIVANNYLYNSSTSHDRSGLLIGASSDILYVDNCLTYGNDATYGDAVIMPIWGSGNNSVLVSAAPTVPDGLEVVADSSASPLYYNMARNSMFFGTYPYDSAQGKGSRFNDPNCYKNVYTDMSAVTTFFSGISEDKIAVVTADKALGAAAETNMPNLDWDIWYVGAEGDMPNLKPAGDMILSAQTLYDAMVLDTADDYGDSTDDHGIYATGLNLKVNPYMTFTFVFGYELEKDKVVVTFKSGDTVIETVTAADMVNNEGAGRYHLYRLKSAPVTALATGITVSVSYNGAEAVDFGTYSAEGFAMLADNASKIQPCSYYATRYEAAKALLFYAQMLDARYGA